MDPYRKVVRLTDGICSSTPFAASATPSGLNESWELERFQSHLHIIIFIHATQGQPVQGRKPFHILHLEAMPMVSVSLALALYMHRGQGRGSLLLLYELLNNDHGNLETEARSC